MKFARPHAKEHKISCRDSKCTPHTGNFFLDEDAAINAVFELFGTSNGTDDAVKEYMRMNWAPTWYKLDANEAGQIPVEKVYMLMRYLASAPHLRFSECSKIKPNFSPLPQEDSNLVVIRHLAMRYLKHAWTYAREFKPECTGDGKLSEEKQGEEKKDEEKKKETEKRDPCK